MPTVIMNALHERRRRSQMSHAGFALLLLFCAASVALGAVSVDGGDGVSDVGGNAFDPVAFSNDAAFAAMTAAAAASSPFAVSDSGIVADKGDMPMIGSGGANDQPISVTGNDSFGNGWEIRAIGEGVREIKRVLICTHNTQRDH